MRLVPPLASSKDVVQDGNCAYHYIHCKRMEGREELAARLSKSGQWLKAFNLKTAAADSIPMDLARFAKIAMRALIDMLTWAGT